LIVRVALNFQFYSLELLSIKSLLIGRVIMQKKYKIGFLIIFFILFVACSGEEEHKEYVIGFSQCMTDDVWRQAMEVEMNIEASNHDNLTIHLRDAKEDNQLQIKHIQELIDRKVDVLVISPNESDFITPIATKAYRAGIPTIIVDRKINSEEYTSYIGGNSYEIGKRAGEYASSLLSSGSVILEIWGTKSTSPAQERHKGFIDGLDKTKNFLFIAKEGKWRKETAKSEASLIDDYSGIDLVYAHNDVMALGVRDVIAERDSSLISKIKILGVDGAFGKDAGLEAVADGRLDASFLYPTGGDQIIKVAMRIVNGEPVDKRYILNTALIDKPTAATLLMQSNQLINYQERIERQRENIKNILNQFSILRHSLSVILILMTVLIVFAIYIFFINQKIRKRNNQLRNKNIETEKQKEQLIALNEQIKEVTEQKVRFFMNVSHEVKTPLTLILNPLEKWIKNIPDSPLHTDLLRMKKNADRLTRVINQLLDFQKIENNKIQLDLSYKDIVSLAASVKSLFDGLAESKNIAYTFTSNQPMLNCWFDSDKIEKVLINLLSNAFKFTPEGGSVAMDVDSHGNTISISVKDNGTGIGAEKLPFVFDRFFSESDNNVTGTGLGLHLSREFITLHGGKISAQSIPNQQTIFHIELPIVKKVESEFEDDNNNSSFVVSELPDIGSVSTNEIINKKYDYTILVVEDDTEIRDYLVEELSENFTVIDAVNGTEALHILHDNNNVKLVLSDILMPEMNGFDLCSNIKSLPELSDIPIILLTALSEIDQQIYGIAEGADDYIQKPFQIDYVKIKIIRLLEERKKLQKKFMKTMQSGSPLISNEEGIISSDKQFLNKFVNQLENSYMNNDISIEKLSEILGVSRVHLHRKIKDITGLSPVDYLRNFRLVKAVKLLEQELYSISEIAYQTGFSSPAYFTKCFKDTFNMTPTEYLKGNIH